MLVARKCEDINHPSALPTDGNSFDELSTYENEDYYCIETVSVEFYDSIFSGISEGKWHIFDIVEKGVGNYSAPESYDFYSGVQVDEYLVKTDEMKMLDYLDWCDEMEEKYPEF